MIKNLIILPNQLFKEIETMEIENIIFYEAEEYFLKYNYNKKKIILHRASMQKFYDELKNENKNKKTGITYFNYKTELKEIIKDFDSLSIFDPINKGIKKKIKDLCSALDIDLSILESPNFLSSNKENKEFFKDNDFFQHKYYQMQRKRLNILLDADGKPEGGKWSFDSKNRKKFPKDVEIPPLPEFNNQYLKEAKSYTAENFADNPGNLENFCYPISRREAEELLNDFIENKLEKFGSYQDGFEKEIIFGFHSLISSSLNIGLLNPKQVVDKVLNYYNENEIPLASVEGFIRQIIGWREYVRAIYQLESEKMIKSNFFKHQRDFPQKFYRAESEIEVLDDSIKKAVDYAYSHHIERLMVLGNFFLLCELDKDQVFKWFMEMYIDAYEWVMFANVYGMSQYSYPEMMTKPYISSSNYILKMSHYKKGEWSKIWDGLYWHFISKNKDKFSDNPRMSLMLSLLDRMDQEKLKNHIKRADKFLEKLNSNK
ncbi:MAG: cryptochrome/photolyase family protein [Bacillota bacterium]